MVVALVTGGCAPHARTKSTPSSSSTPLTTPAVLRASNSDHWWPKGKAEREWEEYEARLQTLVRKRCPRATPGAPDLPSSTASAASLEVAIDPRGELALLETKPSTGNEALAEAAKAALACRAPFPAPTSGLLSLDGRAHFFATLDARTTDATIWHFEPLWLTRQQPPREAPLDPPRGAPLPAPLEPGKMIRWGEFQNVLEGYRVGVCPHNTVPLGASAAAWAAYLEALHKPLHRSFAQGMIARLPTQGDLGDVRLSTLVELVIKADGTLDRAGIVKSSGNIMYHFGVYNAVVSATPYPAPPEEIRSADGLTYLRWSLMRGESQCGTWNAQPFKLKADESGTAPASP